MKKFTSRLAIRSIVAASLFAANTLHAIAGQPGTVDTTWASLGQLLLGYKGSAISVLGTRDVARAMALQPDGKLVVAGVCRNGTKDDFCATRQLPDGSLDVSFNPALGGKVSASVTTGPDSSDSVFVQPDGRILLAGSCDSRPCAVRFNADGSLDLGFGTAGKMLAVSGAYGSATLQGDGKFVLAGSCSVVAVFGFCASRFLPNGQPDTTFNGGVVANVTGTVSTAMFASTNARANAIAVQPDGKIVLAGRCQFPAGNDACALRYLDNGALDPGFATSGTLLMPMGASASVANAVLVQPDGKLVFAVNCLASTQSRFCMTRFLGTGSIDTGFGSSGSVITASASDHDDPFTAGLQPDGRIIVAGRCGSVPAANSFCAVRYRDDGALDLSFGGSGTGKVSTAVATANDQAVSVALQPDGKLLLGGQCFSSAPMAQFCVARYDGGPFAAKNCTMDVDGDNRVLATTDSLIHARIALGLTGPAVVGGITFPATATRTTWPLIRNYLVSQCGMLLP